MFDEHLPDEEIIQALYIDPAEDDYVQYSSMIKEWFGDYINFKWCQDIAGSRREINSGRYDVIFSETIFQECLRNPRKGIHLLMEEPGAADIPVIIVTSSEDTALPINAFRNGVAEFFFKKDLNRALMEYRLRNLLQREFRSKVMNKQIADSMERFQQAHGMSQDEIKDLNTIIEQMKKELEKEYAEKGKLEQERNRIQSLFGMYVDPAIVEGIMSNEISVEKGRSQEISVIFTDIRAYTALAEQMEAEKVLTFLNEYFTALTEVLMGYNGMVDKYIGDSIMGLFGTPIYKESHRDDALLAAMEMQNVFELWQGNWQTNYGIKPEMGVGVASGTAVVGNIGSFQKISYTAVGDTVNIASRLESLAGPGQVLISEDLYEKLSPEIRIKYDYTALEPIAIKGKTGRHQIYSVKEKT